MFQTLRSRIRMSDPVAVLAALQREAETADTTLVCGGRRWRLHSGLLAVSSPFFRAAVTGDFKERQERVVEVRDIEPDAMQQVLDYMHGIPVTGGSVADLLEATERFQMEAMKEQVCRMAVGLITRENAVQLGKLAELYNAEELLHRSAKFIADFNVKIPEDEAKGAVELITKALQAREVKEEERRCSEAGCDVTGQYLEQGRRRCGACAGAPSTDCICDCALPDPLMLVCHYCGLAQHAACYRILQPAQLAGVHLCYTCSQAGAGVCTDKKMPKMVRKAGGLSTLGLGPTCTFRRVVAALATKDEMSAGWLARRFGLEPDVVDQVVEKLQGLAVLGPAASGQFPVSHGPPMKRVLHKYLGIKAEALDVKGGTDAANQTEESGGRGAKREAGEEGGGGGAKRRRLADMCLLM
jgi:hypothetical protein